MKRLIIYPLFNLLLIMGCLPGLMAQEELSRGINFFGGSWQQLLSRAKSQQKLIFVDVYTDWCMPCKQMDAQIFPLAEVGKVYNKLFVSYRLNAEKGEGIELAKRYAIKSYPSFLFLDEDGHVLDRGGDYMQAEAFLVFGKCASEKKNTAGNLAELELRYQKGERDPSFLKNYLVARTGLGLDNSEVLDAYLKVLPTGQLERSEEILFLSANMGSRISNAVPVLIAGLSSLSPAQKNQVADRLYGRLLYYAFAIAIKEKKQAEATLRLKDIEVILPLLSPQHLASVDNLKLNYFMLTKDAVRLKQLGHSLAKVQMSIPMDTIMRKDKELLQTVMKPFLTRKKDSLKIPGFSQEMKLASRQFSGAVASVLYMVASSFFEVLDAGDRDLRDALSWAERAYLLSPNDNTRALRDKLRDKTMR